MNRLSIHCVLQIQCRFYVRKELFFTTVRVPARQLRGTWLFNNCLRMSAIHTANSAVQPVLCFPRCMAWVACFKTKIMAAPTTILLACCLFIGGLCYLKDPGDAAKQSPCAISRVPSTKAPSQALQTRTRHYPFEGSTARAYSGPSTRALPAHALQSLRQAHTCPKSQG